MPTLAEPIWIALVALVLPLGWLLLRFARTMSAARRWVAVAVRACLLTTLALLLAGASSVKETDRLALIVVIDASESVTRFGAGGTDDAGRQLTLREATERVLRQLDAARGPDDLLGAVVFGGSATAVATPTTAPLAERDLDPAVADGTNIAAAIDFARGLVPPDAAGRILLITDGNETAGDAIASAERAATAASPIRIDAIPVDYRVAGETIVEAVTPPARAPADATVPVRVELATTRGTTGTLRLFRDGNEVDVNPDPAATGRRLELPPGRHVVLLEAPLGSGRLSRFRAAFEPDSLAEGRFAGDAQLDNNAAEAFTLSPGLGRVLIVGSGSASDDTGPRTIRSALAANAREVTITDAAAIPSDLLELQDYDLVVLCDVPADEVSERAQRALAAHVTEAGAGLAMVGGRASFGAGGWAGTPIEPILPVHLDLGERLVERRTAIVFVLDRSGSMGAGVGGSFRTQQQIANGAAAAAAATLGPTDLVGVVAFSNSADWVVPLAENESPAATALAIEAITPGGGTNLPPALQMARQALKPVTAAVKHVIVLSDGRSLGDDTLPGIARAMADEGINVSAISVGDSADTDTMFAVAEQGGGVHYPVTNPNVLPRVFVRAVRLVRDPLIKEGEIPVRRITGVSPLIEPDDPLPDLAGIVLTRFRQDPTVINAVATTEDEPVLAHWNAGLGKVAAFTPDAVVWSRPWINAGTFDDIWSRIVQTIARPAGTSDLELDTTITDGQLETRLIATDGQGDAINGLDVNATIYTPSGQPVPVTLDQVAPGEYAASIPVSEAGSYIAIVRPASESGSIAPVLGGATQSTTLEYRNLQGDPARVRRIADAAGGRTLAFDDPAIPELFDRADLEPRRARVPLRDELLIAALALLLLDVAARRVAWDRFLGEQTATASQPESGHADLAALRKAAKREPQPEQARVTLTESDAAEVARQARQRRAEARRAKAPNKPEGPKNDQDTKVRDETAADEEPTGLLAAKRRARDRFRNDDDS